MPAKQVSLGIELEAFLLDSNGMVSNEVDSLIREAHKRGAESDFVLELSKSVIEVVSRPHGRVMGLTRNFFSNLETVIESAERLDKHLYPFGTYPGLSFPIPRRKPWYDSVASVFGPRLIDWCKIAGFHFHFATPRGVIDRKAGEFNAVERKGREAFLNQFNLLVAADPALTTFTQSSPYYEGRLLGKDARLFVYRALSVEKGAPIDGVFKDFSLLGGLPRYATSVSDLKHVSHKRKALWTRLVRERYGRVSREIRDRSPLKFDWGPVRANPIGTIEQRGLDMNSPLYVVGVSSLLKRVLAQAFNGNLRVAVDEVAIKKPFLLEDGVLYVPPYSHVNNKLQYASAAKGLSDPAVFEYCRGFFKAAMKLDNSNKFLVRKISDSLEEKRTKSDEIIRLAGKRKHIEYGEQGELALKVSRNFLDETEKVRQMIANDFEAI